MSERIEIPRKQQMRQSSRERSSGLECLRGWGSGTRSVGHGIKPKIGSGIDKIDNLVNQL